MSDHSELKRLAEACGNLNWRAIQENWTELAIRDDHGYIATMRTKSGKHAGPCSDREAKAKFLCSVTPATVLALIAEVEALREEVRLSDLIIAERDRLLSMFECPAHGQCVPHAMEQVEALRNDAERYRWLREKVGVDFIFGEFSPWLPGMESDMDDSDKKTTDESIDTAMTKGDKL